MEEQIKKPFDWKSLAKNTGLGIVLGLVLLLGYWYITDEPETQNTDIPEFEDSNDIQVATIPYYGESDYVDPSTDLVPFSETIQSNESYGVVCGGYVSTSAPLSPLNAEIKTLDGMKYICTNSTFEYSYVVVNGIEYNISFTEEDCALAKVDGKYLNLNITKGTCILLGPEDTITSVPAEDGL